MGREENKKSVKGIALAAVGLCLGVALLLYGSFGGTEKKTVEEGEEMLLIETYREELETALAALCASVRGAGRVSVFVTLESGYEYVYATDTRAAAGGTTTTYVTVGSGSGESLVYITQKPPEIVGIGVVCEGGMDPTVRQEITALLSAALGVGSNKIYVTGRG